MKEKEWLGAEVIFDLDADHIEGFQEIAQVFRSTADGETAHAFGHLKYLASVGDPVLPCKLFVNLMSL